MTATVTRGVVGSLDTVILQNDRLRAVIIPSLGGRVWELEDRTCGRQWIWHRPGVHPRAVPLGSAYDDVWAGGWEELFPNDAPGAFEGRELPDHGEWWSSPWDVATIESGPGATVTLAANLSVVKAACVKEFRLRDDGGTLSVRYRVRSLEPRPFHFLFKQHIPIAITPDCRLVLPGGLVEPVDPGFSTLLPAASAFCWPTAQGSDRTVDMQIIPARSSDLREFVYIRDLPAAWCGVHDTRHGASLRVDFDLRALPFLWLFLSYGGWRNLYTAVLEPCTNIPKDLADAARLGQSARLEPGQDFATTVSVTVGELPDQQP